MCALFSTQQTTHLCKLERCCLHGSLQLSASSRVSAAVLVLQALGCNRHSDCAVCCFVHMCDDWLLVGLEDELQAQQPVVLPIRGIHLRKHTKLQCTGSSTQQRDGPQSANKRVYELPTMQPAVAHWAACSEHLPCIEFPCRRGGTYPKQSRRPNT
jgi:hypothetical protein